LGFRIWGLGLGTDSDPHTSPHGVLHNQMQRNHMHRHQKYRESIDSQHPVLTNVWQRLAYQRGPMPVAYPWELHRHVSYLFVYIYIYSFILSQNMSMKENRGIPVGISSVSKTGMPTGTLQNSPDTNSKQIKVRENKKKISRKKSQLMKLDDDA
jgi:hypothetical protein